MVFKRRRPPAGVPAPIPEGTLVSASPAAVAEAEDGGFDLSSVPDLEAEPAFAPSPSPYPATPGGPSEDELLMREAQAGNLAAYNQLVTRHERAVFSVCLRLLRDYAAAEDAAQDTFVRAWTNAHTFRGGEVRPWLLRIATNRSYDLLRAKSRRPSGSLDAELFEIEPIWSTQVSDESPDSAALRSELSIRLERALHELPEDQRAVVILSDVQGCSYEEVSMATGAALGTVKSRLSRARARLRQILVDDPDSSELFERFARMNGNPAGASVEHAPTPDTEQDSDDA
ncbi:MAG: RNA polymerase sigma factor [Thermomicrobiales bacterium]